MYILELKIKKVFIKFSYEDIMKKLYTLLIMLLLTATSVFADGMTDEKEIKKNMSRFAGDVNNVGRDYWFTVPPAYLQSGQGNFIKIFVFSDTETDVTVSVPGLGFEQLKKIPRNDVAVFDLSPATAQVKLYSYQEGPLTAKIWRGRGINVTSPKPITVYCVVRYNYTSDGFLCIPTNALGNEYVASPYSSRPIGGPDQSLPNMVGVTATENNTTMKFTVGGNSGTQVPLGNDKYLLPGETKQYKLQRGDVVVFSNRSGAETLTGSYIKADKNIAVVSAHYCADIPVNNQWCDYNGEMDLPLHTWGTHYHIPMVARRKFPAVLRVMAKEDATTVYRDGTEIGYINNGKGGFEQDGWFERRVTPNVPDFNDIALFSGSAPIYVMFYNQGTQEDGQGYDPTDPFSMVISPAEQYQKEIKFSTPAVNGGKNFSNNYVMLVYALNEFGLQPDDLEIATLVDGEFNFKPVVNEGGDRKYMSLEDTGLPFPEGLGEIQYAMKTFRVSQGVHAMRSSLPFAAYAYGGDPYDSYGYPTAAALKDLSVPDTVAPEVTWDIDCIGKIEGGVVRDLPEDDVIRANLYDIRVIEGETFNFGELNFDPKVAKGIKSIPTKTQVATWQIAVEDLTKEAVATIRFMDRAGNETIEVVEYFPQDFNLIVDDITQSDEKASFGSSLIPGDVVVKDFKITNNSDKEEVILDRFELRFGDAGFRIIVEPESPLAPKASTIMKVEFTATTPGRFTDVLGVGNDCLFDFTMDLEAVVGIAYISAEDYTFPTPFNVSAINPQPMKGKVRVDAVCDADGDGVKDTGSDLVIIGIDESSLPPEFTHNITGFPITISTSGGSGYMEWDVFFDPGTMTGDFQGEIVFLTEENKVGGCDPISVIKATAVMQEVSANNMDWEKREILRPGFVTANYDAEGVPLPITFSNSGDIPIQVREFEYMNEILGDVNDMGVFLVQNNNGDYVDMTVAANQDVFDFTLDEDSEFQIPIQFAPTKIGPYRLEYKFNNNQVDETVYFVAGIGIVPNLNVGGMDEGNSFVYDYGNVNYMDESETKIIIANQAENPDYGMDLLLSDIVMDNNITLDEAEFGTNGKSYYIRALKNNVDLPMPITDHVLKQGESIEFVIRFTPLNAPSDANGNHGANITFNSNADNTGANGSGQNGMFSNLIELSGTAIPQGFTVSNNNYSICIGQEQTLSYTIDRTMGNFTIQSIDLGGNNAQYMTLNAPNLPIVLDDNNTSIDFTVTFNPGSVVMDPANENFDIIVASDITDQDSEAIVTSNSTLEATYAERDIQGLVDGTYASENNKKKVDIGDNFKYSLNLMDGSSILSGDVSKLRVSIQYTGHYLVPNIKDNNGNSLISVGDNYKDDYDINDIAISKIDPTKFLYEITFIMEQKAGSNMLIELQGELAWFTFDVILPNYSAEDNMQYDASNLEAMISHNVGIGEEGEENTCITVNSLDPNYILENEICSYTQRFLTLAATPNEAASITGVAIPAKGTNIEFMLAFEGETSLNLINQNGELVKELFKEERPSGENDYFLVPNEISSGIYFLELQSAGYKAVTKVIIQK